MTTWLYVIVMVGIIAVLVAVIVPALFLKKCPSCGARSIIDATECARCGEALPDHRASGQD